MASPTLCEVIYDIDRLRRRSATLASASGAVTAAAAARGVELPSTLSRSQTTMTSYRYSALADSGRGTLSRTSTSPVVRSAACSRDERTSLVRGLSELADAGELSAHRPRHSRTAVGSGSAVRFRFPTEAGTRWSSADNSWPFIADFELTDQPYHLLDGTRARLRWDDSKNIWIAHPYRPVAGWYLKFVAGLPLEERQESDQKRYQLLHSNGTELVAMSPEQIQELRARKAEELKQWKRRRMLQLLNARLAGSRAATDEKGDKNGVGNETTSGQDTPLDGSDDMAFGKRRHGEGEDDDDYVNGGSISASVDDGVGSSTINSDLENGAAADGDDEEGGGRRRRRKALPTAARRRVKFQRDRPGNDEDGDNDDEGRSTKSGTSRDVDGSVIDGDLDAAHDGSANTATTDDNGANTGSAESQLNSAAAATAAGDNDAVAAADSEIELLRHQQRSRPQPIRLTTVCVNCGRIIEADATEPHQCRKVTPLRERSLSGGHRRVGTPGESAASADRRGPLRRKPAWLVGGDDPEPRIVTPDSVEESARRDSNPPPPPSPRVSLGLVQRPSLSRLESRPGGSPDQHSIFKDVLAERQRRRMAARRRRRDTSVYRRFKDRRPSDQPRNVDADSGNLEDYDWLSKYCILDANKIKMYQATFEDVDIDCAGRLDCIDTMIALQAVNPLLNDADEEFIYTILESAGYSITSGSDSRLFALLAALSFRITSLDEWMRNIIRSTDCRALANKMLKCKTLWECCIRAGSRTISIDELCVELRAGGVREDHEQEVRSKLGPPRAPLDLLDFLTYAPLFVMIHSSVIDNPLNNTRDK